MGECSSSSAACFVKMNPLSIKFSQSAISPAFRRVSLVEKQSGLSYSEALKLAPRAPTLESLLSELVAGEVKIEDVPMISVVNHQGDWYSLDNRRLYVFRRYAELMPEEVLIPVKIVNGEAERMSEFFKKLDSKYNGDRVDIFDAESQAFYIENQKLTEEVLKWSIADICNDSLLRNQVTEIPSTFTSLKKYLLGFTRPLLEETRAVLKQSLEGIADATRGVVLEGQELKTDCATSFRKFQFTIKVVHCVDPSRKPPFRGKDLVLLTTTTPTCLEDLKSPNVHYTLALLQAEEEPQEGQHQTQESQLHPEALCFKALVYAHVESPLYEALLSDKSSWRAIYMNSLATMLRIWDSLHRPLEDNSTRGCELLQEILNPVWRLQSSDNETETSLKALQKQCSEWFSLNASQMQALSTAVVGLEFCEPPPVRLIQGPPGTGKTSVLVTMLSVLSTSGRRVLMCAPTNTAILEVVWRFLNAVKHGGGPFEDSGRCKIRPGDLVLLGNEDKLGVDEASSEVFLPHRVQRLSTVLSGTGGWLHKVLSVMDFARNAVDIFERDYELSLEVKGTDFPRFLEFVRKRLKLLGEEMMRQVEIVCSDLPSNLLKSTDILGAGEILQNVLILMHEDVSESVARRWFKNFETEHVNARGTVPGELRALLKLLNQNLDFVDLQDCRRNILSKQDLIKHAAVVFCTASSAGKREVQQSNFDLAIIDEAAQLVEAECTIIMGTAKLKQIVLVGDHQQLPATVISTIAAECGYGRSAFQRLQELNYPSIMLDTQYRMHPSISLFPSNKFYGGKVLDGPNVTNEGYGRFEQNVLCGAYKFLNVSDGWEVKDDDGHSIKNPMEVEIVMHILRKLIHECKRGKVNVDIGVISPYASQVEAIRDRVEALNYMEQVEVKSVDGFQGREKDVILFSTVRSKHLGFLQDYRRLNVAITRARNCLWIIGNAHALTEKESAWKDLIADVKMRGHFMDCKDDPGIRKIVARVKNERKQLEEMLKPGSITFNTTTWKVHLSKDFMSNFTRISNEATKKVILNCILKLANGFRCKHKRQVPIPSVIAEDVEIYISSSLYLVWSVGLHQSNQCQVIRIWDVVTYDKLPRVLRRLANLFQTYTDDYLSRCRKRAFDYNGLSIPACFEHGELIWYASLTKENIAKEAEETVAGEQCEVSESLAFMKFYQMSSDVARKLLSSSEAASFDLLFEVTKEEAAAIDRQQSTFIVGRSGTGKTTVITAKVLQREKLGSTLDGSIRIRQLLVTVSSKLCTAIKHHIDKVQRGSSIENQEAEKLVLDDDVETKLFNDIPDTFVDLPLEKFPLVITYRKLLAMLDGSVKIPFIARKREALDNDRKGMAAVDVRQSEIDAGGDEFDEEFVDTFANENEDEPCNVEVADEEELEVNYDRFISEYWPHMDSTLTRKLDPTLVFAEIMSCIKGSNESLNSPNGRLGKDSYIELASKRISAFDENERASIYKLYIQYERRKRQKRHYDIGDYVFHLFQQIQDGGFLGTKVDFVYVDEVQDLTLGQICLFKYLTDRVEQGFVFAGDTAQTINKGVTFRFEDIRSLFYSDFLGRANASVNTSKELKGTPDLIQLTQNFRTHDGIIKLACNVMRLILHFFPDSVDKLAPESSIVCGEKPVVLQAEGNNMIDSLFQLDATNAAGHECEFGAQQVILVRNLESKKRLSKQLENRSLVLTIEECKGLEFQDVLLFNFFTDSCFGSNKWRVLYQYLEDSKLPTQSFPKFDQKSHSLLCSELKHLYVALTRSKQRLWIYDENYETQKPMLDCWLLFDLVMMKKLDLQFIRSIHTESTPEEWRRRGIEMLNEKQYESAKLCFQRADEPSLITFAEAASLQQQGDRASASSISKKQIYRKAAELFLSVRRFEYAARCSRNAEDYRTAGELYRDHCGKPEDAGDCFSAGKLYSEASECYASGNNLHKCLQACQNGKLFGKALEFIQKWKTTWGDGAVLQETATIDTFLRKVAKIYKNKGDMDSMMTYLDELPSLEAKCRFLEREKLFLQLLQVQTRAGNFKGASEIAETMGDFETAVDLLEKAGKHNEAALKIVKYLQQQALWGDGNRGWPPKAFENSTLIRKAKALANEDPTTMLELKVMEAAPSSSVSELLENWKLTSSDPKVELIALHQLLDSCFEELLSSSTAAPALDLQHLSKGLDGVETFREQKQLLQLTVFTWNTWFGKISSMLDGLSKVQNVVPPNLDSCLEYLGVSRQTNPGLFTVFDIRAFWLKEEVLSPLPNQGNRGMIRMQRLLIRAQEFWKNHLFDAINDSIKKLRMYADGVSGAERVILFLKLLDMTDDLTRLQNSIKRNEPAQDAQGDTKLQQSVDLQKQGEIYRREIYRSLFMDNVNSSLEVCMLRDDPKVKVHLDIEASKLVGSSNMKLTMEEAGKLQILLPFLSRSWTHLKLQEDTPFSADLQAQASDLTECLKFFSREANRKLSCPSFVLLGSYLFEGLHRVYSTENWQCQKDYMKMPTFLYLLEKAVVVISACTWHLTDVIIPKSLVIEFMTTRSQEGFYTTMLRSECKQGGCKKTLPDLLKKIANICIQLLTRGVDLEKWLKMSNAKSDLPRTVYRLIRILITLFMEQQNGLKFIYEDLKFLVDERSPLLKELPSTFRQQLLETFRIGNSPGQTRQAFKKMMESVADPFLILKRYDKQRSNMRGIQIVPVEKTRWTFSTSAFFQRALATKATATEDDASQPAQIVEEEINTDTDAENKFSALTYESPNLEELPTQEVEEDEACAVWYVKFGDQKVCWFVARRLLKALKALREQDDYVRDAKRYLRPVHSDYVVKFITEVCPLKAKFHNLVANLESAIQMLESQPESEVEDEFLERMKDFLERAASLDALLDPRHENHKKLDEHWLRHEVIKPAKAQIESGEREFGKKVQGILEGSGPSKGMSKHQMKKQQKEKRRGKAKKR